jgi:hypothetical protein
MNLKPFVNHDSKERAAFKNVPIEFFFEVKALLAKNGLKHRIRFRGTRTHPNDTRTVFARWQDCDKQFANRFSIYVSGQNGYERTQDYYNRMVQNQLTNDDSMDVNPYSN